MEEPRYAYYAFKMIAVLNRVQGHSSVMPLARGQGGPEFGSSNTPIPTREGRLC